MKQFLLAALMVTGALSSQNLFKPGYIVNNEGVRTECLIRDQGWKNNPVSFDYKSTQDGETLTGNLTNVQEFAVPGDFKFVRANTDIDRTGAKLASAALKKAPDFINETLFLKTLVDGEQTLYHYFDSGLERFFYKNKAGEIKPLVFKYHHPLDKNAKATDVNPEIDRSRVVKNNQYRNQLWNEVKCPSTSMSTVERLDYTVGDLTRYFEQVNTCLDPEKAGSQVVSEQKQGKLKISPTIGFATNTLQIDGFEESATSVPFGVEFEYILPTNNNKLAVFIEFNYNSIEVSDDNYNPLSASNKEASAEYSFLEMPAGMRYYFFLNDNSKIFLSGIFAVDFTLSSSFKVPLSGAGEFEKNYYKIGGGIGYNYKRLSIEARAFTGHGLSANQNIDTNFAKMGLVLRYNILK